MWTRLSRLTHVAPIGTKRCFATTEAVADLKTYANEFQVVMDHPKFLIINKNAGIGVQDDSKRGLSRRQGVATLLKAVNPEIRSVHRLDKNVTGGVVFAKDPQTARMISKNLKVGGNSGYKFTRRYIAVVEHADLDSQIDGVEFCDSMKTCGTVTTTGDNGSHEQTKFIITGPRKGKYRVAAIELMTGKKHQIRRHFGEILKWPILNDFRYGGHSTGDEAIGLHSSYISLKIGLQEYKAMIPISYSKQLWAPFINNKGEFHDNVIHSLENFDQIFHERALKSKQVVT